jgi:hypothetical protein
MNNSAVKIKYGIILGLVIVVGLIAFYVYQTIYRSDKVQVTVSTIPSDATITLNKKIVGNGDIYVVPGDYTVVIEKPGFATQTNTVTFTKPTGTIDIALTPESTEAKTWATAHASYYTAYEGRAGAISELVGQAFQKINPVVKNLPFQNLLFMIGYLANPTDASGNSIIVTIDAPEGYRQAAINKIAEWGIKAADLNIIFTGYENPFSL